MPQVVWILILHFSTVFLNFSIVFLKSVFLNCFFQKCVLQFKRREATGGWDANFSSWHRRIIFCHHSSYKLKSKVLKILLVWIVSKCTKSKTHSCLNLKYLCFMDLYKCISIPHLSPIAVISSIRERLKMWVSNKDMF